MNNLKVVLHQLKSDKIKERQEGLSSLKTTFTRDSAVLKLDESGDGRAWLVVFQALYTAVALEKAAATKKGVLNATTGPGATALRRLGEATSTVRWLTERSVQRMNKKVAKSLLTHLMQTMVYHGELLGPIALDYAKAMRCLVSWTPHLDHLDEEMWVSMVELALNIILGDHVRRSLNDDEGEVGENSLEMDVDFSEDPDAEEEDNKPSTSTGQSRKRRRSPPKSTTRSKSVRASRTPRAVSPEQVEFATLLAILLRSSSAPLLSPNHPYLAQAILSRLQRFVDVYPPDSTLYHDCLHAISATLAHLSLNKRDAVSKFASGVWDGLVEVWRTKNKRMKESLLTVLKVLFPFVTASDDSTPGVWAEGLGRLWQLLDGEAESRWGVDGLSLDSLRLQVAPLDAGNEEEDEDRVGAFMARTFRYGWQFDSNQALAWAILELQADCLEKLFLLSESMRGSSRRGIKGEGKRARLENPMALLLSSIQNESAWNIRTYRLQVLLFFIDRHWSVLHDDLQEEVINLLNQYISVEDGVTQSWVFLCFAAIAYDDGLSRCQSSHSGTHSGSQIDRRVRKYMTWDSIWTHAMRRANVGVVCRAACHTAYTLLLFAKDLLSSQSVLMEIEAFSKDLDVQGPSFPYDSVCKFLTMCLKVASQDVRLYRMQVEEKVLSWLVDAWRVVEGSARSMSAMPPNVVTDILALLESICGLSKRSQLACRIPLPDCAIAHTMVEEQRTSIIRDFILHARLPPYRIPGVHTRTGGLAPDLSTESSVSFHGLVTSVGEKDSELVEPRARERRASSFLLKLLEDVLVHWELAHDIKRTTERARRALDLAIIALSLESSLIMNGTRSNRRVIQGACKVISLVMPLLTNTKMTGEEKSLVLLGLEPLISAISVVNDDGGWETILPPDEGTGIRRQMMRSLMLNPERRSNHTFASRRHLQRLIWQSTDVQDAFIGVLKVLRNVIGTVLGLTLTDPRSPQTLAEKDRDDFGESSNQTPRLAASVAEMDHRVETQGVVHCTVQICVAFLAVAPILQSSSGEATRDKELSQILLSCEDEKFLVAAGPFFDNVREQTLNLSVSTLDNFLDKFEALLTQYSYSRSENLQLLAIHFLDSTSHIWLGEDNESPASKSVIPHVLALCRWLSGTLKSGKIRSWKIRDRVARFLDRYLGQDPYQRFWSMRLPDDEEEEEPDNLPAAMLPALGADEDIRVRFRVAVLNARLFSLARALGHNPLPLYSSIKQWLSTDLDNYEHMLTRLLCLGNIMVVSSDVRRGPYWHLLETCLHTSVYTPHVEAVLLGVSGRMGLSSLSQLFESYASQIAYSIRQGELDFLRFPPHLLGYSDRRQCAEATFRAFSPTNILAGGSSSIVEHGRKLFSNHCRAIQKTAAQGIHECFSDIIGYQIVFWVDDHMDSLDTSVDELRELLTEKTKDMGGEQDLDKSLREKADGIVAAILRTLGDQDFSEGGTIVQALRLADDHAALAFQAMSRYRTINDFRTHDPNLPSYSAMTVLHALRWFGGSIPEATRHAISYHLLHQLFADVERSFIVNEQMRLLNGICIWVAYQHHHFQEPTLLHTIINGAATLLAQVDLAHAAQSMLEWAFGIYRKVLDRDPRFPDVLIRISCLAYDYSQDKRDTVVSQLGCELFEWIELQTLEFSKINSIRSQVIKAIPAWPQEPCPELALMYDDVTSESLSTTLGDQRMSSNKFRIVRRLRDLAAPGDQVQFSKSDFWRLKECIPPSGQLQDSDVDAFAALLIMHKGYIQSFVNEQASSLNLRTRHRRYSRKRDENSSNDATASPHRSIVLTLLAMLDSTSASHVHSAYHTLRFLVSASSANTLQSHTWPSDARRELEYLQAYPLIPREGKPCNVQELLDSESFADVAKEYSDWITTITRFLIDVLATEDPFYAQLSSILITDVNFAEQILPVLVHTVLQAERCKAGLSEHSPVRTVLSKYLMLVTSSESVSVSCLRVVVDVVLHLRHFRPANTNDALAYDKWLDIDFTVLSKSSLKCGAYTTALLFLELANEYQYSSREDVLDEQILYDIYSHIDEPDGFYGIKTRDLRQFLMKRFHHEKQWEKAFKFHGAALEAGTRDSGEAEGIVQSLHSFGFHHLAIATPQTVNGDLSTMPSSQLNFRLGWRTQTWDLPDQTEEWHHGASLYRALRAVYRERDQRSVDLILRKGLHEETERLRTLGDENLVEIRQVTQDLMSLSQIKRWRTSSIQKSLQRRIIDTDNWADFCGIDPGFEFSDLETILATRVSLVRSASQKEQREQVGTVLSPFAKDLVEVEKKCLIRLSEAARDAHQLQVALNSIVRAQQLDSQSSFEVSQEFASVLWLQQEQKLAVQLLKELLNASDNNSALNDPLDQKKAMLLARLGTWTSEACLEKPTDILAHYFDPAVASLGQLAAAEPSHFAHATVYQQCAMFAERQYHAILRSDDAIRWKVYMDRKTQEIRQRRDEISKTQSHSSTWEVLTQVQKKAQAILKQDEEQWKRHNSARDAFLHQAIDMYSRCLEASDTFDDNGAIRFCSLWFANFDKSNLQTKIRMALERVASRKFVFLSHQLSARISRLQGDPDSKGQGNLQGLLIRMCREHPFHSLYQVYCLRPERSSSQSSTTSRRHSSRHESPSVQIDRANAAGEIFDRLRNEPSISRRISSVEALCDASLEWAKYPIKDRMDKKQKGPIQVPDTLSIRRIHDLEVPIMTIETPVDPTMLYNNCIWVNHYETTFDTAGGVNLPKIINCVGSDGEKYKQLFKGEGADDMRQDAVMEQVFDLVNVVLRRDIETRRRDLSVRGYKVIPLASQAGVIQFVTNTTPLQAWLLRAHMKYRPNDMKHNDIHSQLSKKRHECGGQAEPLLALFLEIRKKFRPVMRHYFTEWHKTPMSWFSMRLNYTRSVATTSIVGHILGLGDRHTSNILMDNGTGQVVHIDLGIAFDQGKVLPVPERVPFRMTADMVDGMGMSGTQGVFQRCAEETLRVLREGSEVVMTVLEVFKHDPLHSWTASELKRKRVQGESEPPAPEITRLGIGIDMASGTADEAADRALTSVARKLDKSLSVEYTVNDLIAEATDPVNLATIYAGWGPQY